MSATHEDERPDLDAHAHDDNTTDAPQEQDKSDIVRVPEAEKAEVKVEPHDEDWDAESLVAFESLEAKRKARKRKRLIRTCIIIAAIAAIAVAVIMNMMKPPETEEEVVPDVAPVELMDFEITVSSDGALEPNTSTIVTPEVGGVIENLSVAVGQNVKEGDVLFTLKNDTLDKEVTEAEHAVTTAERAVQKANRARDKEWATYNKNFDEYERNASSEEGEAEVPEAPDDESLIADIEDAELDLQEKREAYDEAVKKAEKRTVKAPTSGAVLTVNAVNGMSIDEGGSPTSSSESNTGPLVQIVDVSSMKVTINVDESEITKLKADQKARVTFSAISDLELEARVVEIATAAGGGEDGSYGDGSGSATFPVKLEIPKPDKRLKPGMTASVEIITLSIPEALVVPTKALSIMETNEDGSGTATAEVVVDEETYETETRDVTFSVSDVSETVVTKGLKEGELLLLDDGGSMDVPSESDVVDGSALVESLG